MLTGLAQLRLSWLPFIAFPGFWPKDEVPVPFPTAVSVLSLSLTTNIVTRFCCGSLVLNRLSPEPPADSDVERSHWSLTGLLVPVESEHSTLLILGVLLTLRYLVPLLQPQVKDTSLKGSFGVTRKELEVSPSTEQLIQVGAVCLLWCLYVNEGYWKN